MSAKKTFAGNNPALQFISATGEPDGVAADLEVTSYRTTSLLAETKSRRVQLLLKPSLFNRLKDRADVERLSLNELIHQLLESAADRGGA